MENDALREQVEEESEGRSEAQRHLAKVNSELSQLRAKFDGEAVARAEELEESRRKLQIKVSDLEEQLNTALSKNSSLEKTKARLAGECEDLMIDVERVSTAWLELPQSIYGTEFINANIYITCFGDYLQINTMSNSWKFELKWNGINSIIYFSFRTMNTNTYPRCDWYLQNNFI